MYGPSRLKAGLDAKYRARDDERVWTIIVATLGGMMLGHVIVPALLWMVL